jgi:hypothetical protein
MTQSPSATGKHRKMPTKSKLEVVTVDVLQEPGPDRTEQQW